MSIEPSGLRTLHYTMRGSDVLACQRAVRKALAAHHLAAANRQSRFYGDGTVKDILRLQNLHGAKADGICGGATWSILLPHVDAYGKWLLGRAPKPLTPTEIGRARVVHQWLVMLALAPRRYAQERPYPHTIAEFVARGSDCSGSVECGCETARVPDPNGTDYDGGAWTQSQDKQGVAISETEILGAELSFYERPSGHVTGEFGDGTVFSHGHAGGPRRLIRHYRGDYAQTRRYPLAS